MQAARRSILAVAVLAAVALPGMASANWRGGARDTAPPISVARAESGVSAKIAGCSPGRFAVRVHIPLARGAERRANALIFYERLPGEWVVDPGTFSALRHPDRRRVNFTAAWRFSNADAFGFPALKARVRVWYVNRHGRPLGSVTVTTGVCA